MITKKIYISKDGTEFTNKKDCIIYEGYYVCPKCDGKGYVMERYNAYPTNLPDSGFIDDFKYRKINCDICGGAGYTKKQLKEIKKVTVIGYE